MRAFVLKLAIFLMLSFALFSLLEWACRKSEKSHLKTQYEALNTHQKYNLVIFGDSRARAGIHPKYLECFDESVYNFAMDGNCSLFYIAFYAKLYKWYFHQIPETVLLCVNWDMFRRGGKVFEHDSAYWPWPFFLKALKDAQLSKQVMLMNRLSSIRIRNGMLSQPIQQKIYYRGYSPFTGQSFGSQKNQPESSINIVASAVAESKSTESKNSDILMESNDPAGQQAAFEGLLNQFKSDGVRVILVRIPDCYPAGVNPDEEMKKEIKAETAYLTDIAQGRNIPFLDYNDFIDRPRAINFQKQFFHDPGHLNDVGSIVFTKMLRDDLAKILPMKSKIKRDSP